MSFSSKRWLAPRLLRIGILTLGLLLLEPLPERTNAVSLRDGRTAFEQSPRLIRAAASFSSPFTPSNYHFTIQIPEDAGEPLGSVTIVQRPNLEQLPLYPEESRAFLGNDRGRRSSAGPPFQGGERMTLVADPPVAIAATTRPSSGNEITVTFEQPIEPGNTVTVAIRGRNPRYGGIYQFGITAFPAGIKSQGLYLGSGRIHFSLPGGRGG